MNLKVLFSQLRPWLGLRILIFTAFNKVLNPYANIFYGFSAEDQVIETLLNYPKHGYYVDVGCNHPIKFSNTFNFYLQGWKGITIDANPEFIALQKETRPKDVSICCAISDAEKDVVFYKFREKSLSTINPTLAGEFEKSAPIISKEHIKTRTLNSIFEENSVPGEFEFLSIDVEGHDYEALCGIDFEKYRPKLIIIEMLDFSLINFQANKVVTYLESRGYRMIGFYHVNGYFIRSGN